MALAQLFVFLSRMVSGEGWGIRLYRFHIIAFSSTFQSHIRSHPAVSGCLSEASSRSRYCVIEQQSHWRGRIGSLFASVTSKNVALNLNLSIKWILPFQIQLIPESIDFSYLVKTQNCIKIDRLEWNWLKKCYFWYPIPWQNHLAIFTAQTCFCYLIWCTFC